MNNITPTHIAHTITEVPAVVAAVMEELGIPLKKPRFTTTNLEMTRALATVTKAVGTSRYTLEILTCVLIHIEDSIVTMTATNLEYQISTTLVDPTAVDGDMVIGHKKLTEMLKGIPPKSPVTLSFIPDEASSGSVAIDVAPYHYTLKAWDANDFPVVKSIDGNCATVVLDYDKLVEAVRFTALAAADDDSRPVLTGLLLRKDNTTLNLYGADAFRIIESSVPVLEGSEYFEALISARVFGVALGAFKGERVVLKQALYTEKHFFSLTCGNVTVIGQTIDGTYPNVLQAIPRDCDVTVTINREAFVQAVKRAYPVAKDASNITRFAFNGSCKVEAHNDDKQTYNVEVPCTTVGGEFKVILNCVYISNVLDKVKDETLTLQLSLPKQSEYNKDTYYQRPVSIKPLDERFAYVLMPMSTNR